MCLEHRGVQRTGNVIKKSPSFLTIFTLFFVLVALFAVGRYALYGSVTRNCVYTEETLPVPEPLIELEVVVVNRAYLAVGSNKDFTCLKKLGSIDREVVSAEIINNVTIGRRYFTVKGMQVESLNKGARFKVVDVVAVTKHGITTIDSGPGPIYFLILKDKNETLYRVATASLGQSKEDLFLALEDPALSPVSPVSSFLNWGSFDETSLPDGTKSFRYTGKLIELSKAYLQKNRSFLETLYDRMEEGEIISISIELELQDRAFKKIALSENSDERFTQIAQIQNNFLQKIPDKFNLEDVEKNLHNPYISMKASPELLDYLATEQTMLHIKTIGEIAR